MSSATSVALIGGFSDWEEKVSALACAHGRYVVVKILVVGAGGYVGSRVVSRLSDRGHDVIAGVRDIPRESTSVTSNSRIAHCDVLEAETVFNAVHDGGTAVDAVLYLVHRMSHGRHFAVEDARGARTMCQAMERFAVKRCVYLSGLKPDCADYEISAHMSSRSEVETLLADGPTPTVAVRAGIILGAGSTSFEVLRRLCELLPIQPIPRWMRHKVEPVAERDVVEALCGAIEGGIRSGHVDIGCGEKFTYPELLRLYSRVAGKPVLQFPAPPVPWDLVAHGLARVVSHDGPTVAALIESLQHDMVCENREKSVDLMPYQWRWSSAREAIIDALSTNPSDRNPIHPVE